MKRFRFSDAIERLEAKPTMGASGCSRTRVEVS